MPIKDSIKRAAYHKKYMKGWYAKNKTKHQAMVARRHEKLIQLIKSKRKQCILCPENHPSCLDFHHRDPESKEIEMSRLGTQGWSMKRILAEIEKCDVMCANCHRKEHWKIKLLQAQVISDKF